MLIEYLQNGVFSFEKALNGDFDQGWLLNRFSSPNEKNLH